MIFPGDILEVTKKHKKEFLSSFAFILVVLNVFSYIFLFQTTQDAELNAVIKQINKPSNLKQMQSMYIQSQDVIRREEIKDRLENDPYLFIKDQSFWKKAQNDQYFGDSIVIESNRQLLKQLHSVYKKSNQEVYGIGQNPQTPWNWITYQFTHANLFHLLSNVIFLFLVVMLLEKSVSLGWIMIVYIMSGLGAGVNYLMMSNGVTLPVIGASGSISGLIAFLCVVKGSQNIAWSYFIGPLKGMYGTIYMPAFFLFPAYLLSDFTSTLISSYGVSQSVAHSAHVGGAITGLFLGTIYLVNHYFFVEFFNIKK